MAADILSAAAHPSLVKEVYLIQTPVDQTFWVDSENSKESFFRFLMVIRIVFHK